MKPEALHSPLLSYQPEPAVVQQPLSPIAQAAPNFEQSDLALKSVGLKRQIWTDLIKLWSYFIEQL